MKKLIAITLLIVTLITVASAEESAERMYLRFGEVVDLEYDTDCVTVDDGLGNLWEFYGVDYFFFGDLAVMIMSDNGTADWIYDDYVINAYICSMEDAQEIVKNYKLTY